MRRVIRVCIAACVMSLLSVGNIWAQASEEDFVRDHISLFDQILSVLGMTSGLSQESYLGHIGISPEDRPLALAISNKFRTQENQLRDEAQKAINGNLIDREATLTSIRARRSKLLTDSATELLRNLGGDSRKRIKGYVERVAASMPSEYPPRSRRQ